MNFSKHSLAIIALALAVFAGAFAAQAMYYDSYTKKLSLPGMGPVFVGTLSANLQNAATRPFTVQVGQKAVTLPPEQIQGWIEPYDRIFTGTREYRLNVPAIAVALDDFAPVMATKPVNAQFGVADGQLIEIVPAVTGRELDLAASLANITRALVDNQSYAVLAVAPVEPELTLIKLRGMGVTDYLGQGKSNFAGSISSRVHNISVAAKKLNGVIVAPGEEFSFNEHLGNTGPREGYLPGLVIKDGKLTPEYGGGVCQVSTTMFRAAMESGLKITARRAHSLPVRYYNPQGYDATVYPPLVDLKFVNDTPGYILIQSKVEGTYLMFDVFGTYDGRSVAIDGPYQYGAQPDGSLKAVISRTVTYADGTNHKDAFYSAYKSPALYEVVRNPLE